jgi:GntR family transcriptional regulator
MNIIINNSSDLPIYEQIASQIKSLIIKGILKEGEALPSMRTLAKDLKISLITTKRAYEELERDGFIVSYTGKGSFVNPQNTNLVKEESLKQVEDYLSKAIEQASFTGIELDELIEMLKLLYDK